MNFNNILVGITLLISLITFYTIYNVNNNMDKLLDTDTDDGYVQRLSIIKYAKENNLKLMELERMMDKQRKGILNMLTSMMKYNESREEKRGEDAKVQRGLLKYIAQGLGGVPRDTTTRMITRSPVARRAF